MCCIFTLLVVLGPRVAGVIWWLVRPALWQTAFNTIIWPILGLIFLPWTTLMYMLVFPGGVVGFEWVLARSGRHRRHRLLRWWRLRKPQPYPRV